MKKRRKTKIGVSRRKNKIKKIKGPRSICVGNGAHFRPIVGPAPAKRS
jgi:hypothetical protein